MRCRGPKELVAPGRVCHLLYGLNGSHTQQAFRNAERHFHFRHALFWEGPSPRPVKWWFQRPTARLRGDPDIPNAKHVTVHFFRLDALPFVRYVPVFDLTRHGPVSVSRNPFLQLPAATQQNGQAAVWHALHATCVRQQFARAALPLLASTLVGGNSNSE